MCGENRSSEGRQNSQLLKLQQNRFFALDLPVFFLRPVGWALKGYGQDTFWMPTGEGRS